MGDDRIIVVLLGPPGSGKGTQGALLAERAGIQHVSTGEMFRAAVSCGTSAGLRAEAYLESGELVPDGVVMQLVEEYLDNRRGQDLCLDGFPRTRRQAEALDSVLEQLGTRLAGVFLLEISDEEALRRLSCRGRSDDGPETAKYRLELYHELTEPLVDYYYARGVLRRVDGEAEIEVVANGVERLVAEAR